jgi:RNA polymerase sigma factor (TIGR02999 family)
MAEDPKNLVTRLLGDWSRGNRDALDELLPLVHTELYRLARLYMARERGNHTLQPTALINEAYLKLVGERDMAWESRSQFVGVAAQLMRNILVDYSRRKNSGKRGGGAKQVTLDDSLAVDLGRTPELLDLDDALTRLAMLDPRKARIAELRFFGGLDTDETAAALSVSVATVTRDWRFTKAWLQKELGHADA